MGGRGSTGPYAGKTNIVSRGQKERLGKAREGLVSQQKKAEWQALKTVELIEINRKDREFWKKKLSDDEDRIRVLLKSIEKWAAGAWSGYAATVMQVVVDALSSKSIWPALKHAAVVVAGIQAVPAMWRLEIKQTLGSIEMIRRHVEATHATDAKLRGIKQQHVKRRTAIKKRIKTIDQLLAKPSEAISQAR